MGRFYIKELNPEAIQLENIFAVMSKEYFGKDLSAKIVGGVKKLEDLIAAGKIEAHKPNNVQNGKWYCNAAQVLQNCRNMRRTKQQRTSDNFSKAKKLVSQAREGELS